MITNTPVTTATATTMRKGPRDHAATVAAPTSAAVGARYENRASRNASAASTAVTVMAVLAAHRGSARNAHVATGATRARTPSTHHASGAPTKTVRRTSTTRTAFPGAVVRIVADDRKCTESGSAGSMNAAATEA